MKSKAFFFLILLIPFCALAQISQPPQVADDDFAPALLIMGVTILMGMVAVTLALFVLLLIVAAITAFLVFCGLLSISVLTSLYYRSFSKGTLLFMKGAFTLAGCTVGATIALVMKTIIHFNLSLGSTLLAGLLLGGIVGLLIATILVKTGRMLLQKVVVALK